MATRTERWDPDGSGKRVEPGVNHWRDLSSGQGQSARKRQGESRAAKGVFVGRVGEERGCALPGNKVIAGTGGKVEANGQRV